jgi:hypothetical protein
VTFTVFPGTFFDAHLTMMKNVQDQKSWYFITSTLIFNCLDTCGRFLGGKIMTTSRVVIFGSLLRTIFVVTTILIATDDGQNIFIENDAFKLINMVLFSISNGYIST